jgi:hypothetical protein
MLPAADPQTTRFQHGPVAEAGLAITALQGAENWLSRRTLDRMSRGVEGRDPRQPRPRGGTALLV